MQDYPLLEKLAHFNRERIPERGAREGLGRFGTLTVTHDITSYTRLTLLAVARRLRCSLRFSTVAGELGAADAERDVRGFALKFYTEEGNWDIVGNNTPVFFVRDPSSSPTSSTRRSAIRKTNLRSPRRCGISGRCRPRPASGHHPDVGPRVPAVAALHGRFRIAHL